MTSGPPVDGTDVDPELERELAFSALLEASTPRWFVTNLLIAVNVLVFVAMTAGGASAVDPSVDVLLRWGANYGPLIAHGEWWRLVTAAFVHIGIIHLAMNMFVLWANGRLIERLLGQGAFVALYGLSAIGSSLASVATHPMTTSAGASGAIFGLYGGLIAFLLVRRSSLPSGSRSAMMQNTITFVIYNVLYGLMQKHVDMAAHIGGLATGVVVGGVMAATIAPSSRAPQWRRALAVSAAAIAIFAVAARRLPVFDNWIGALSEWTEVSQRVEARYDESVRELGARKLTREQFAERIEKTLVPPIADERKRLASLRLPPAERTVAQKIVTYLALRAEALSQLAAAERTGDAVAMEQAQVKSEQALAARLAIMPNAALSAQLAASAKDRARQRAFAAEVERLGAVDKACVAAYQDALKKLRVNRWPPAEFAFKVEHDVLKPWLAERQQLAKVDVAEGQKAARQRLLDYMDLRAEGWQLIATGARTNDTDKLRLGNEKHAAASKLLAAPAPQPDAPSAGPKTPQRHP